MWKYRILRRLSRWTVETAAAVTLQRMPPFVSAAAIVEQDGRILMIRDTAQNMLVLPGGHLRWNEGVKAGVEREVLEETGYRIEVPRVFQILDNGSGLSDRGIVRVIFEGSIRGGRERSSPEGEVEWVELDRLKHEEARDAQVVRRWMAPRDAAGMPPREG